jgi:type I restriction-modification system DNA methylase subunit
MHLSIIPRGPYDAILTNPNQLMLAGFLPEPVKIASSRTNIVGLHFTPPALARTLVEETLRLINLQKETITIFDRLVGSGEFLREAIRQLGIHGYTGRVHVIGWDISDIACAMARYELGWEITKCSFSVTMTIDCKDMYIQNCGMAREVDIVLMNPPFLSFEDMVEQQKKVVKEILGPVTGSRPDLSNAFLLQAISLCLIQEKLEQITVSVLDGISSQKIRVVLAEELQTSIVAKIGSHQLFPGAIVDPAFYLWVEKKK